MDELNLDAYLASQRDEGSMDSEGGFSVSTAEAARKLARFALPHPYAWITKVVQAAVGWSATGLVLRQTREFSSFHFAPAKQSDFPKREELLETLLSSEIGGTQPLQRMSIALRAMVEQAGLSFVLGVNPKVQEPYSIYAGHDVSQLSSEVRAGWAQDEGVGLRLTVSHQRLGEFWSGRYAPRFLLEERRDLEISGEMERVVFCSPMPVSLDGRRLDGFRNRPGFGFNSTHRPLLISGAKAEPVLRMPDDVRERSFSVFHGPNTSVARPPGRKDFGVWFMIRVLEPTGVNPRGGVEGLENGPARRSAEPDHVLYWVCDGVVVEKETLRCHCWVAQLRVFINASGLQTDLTGLTLVDSPQRRKRATQSLQAVSSVLEKELRSIEHYTVQRPGANLDTYEREFVTDTLAGLPGGVGRVGFVRKLVKAGIACPRERRTPERLDYWRQMLGVDLERLVRMLSESNESSKQR